VNTRRILLADDSVTIRKVVELTFADEGIDVVSVADGDEAMKKFVEIAPDMVIADVNMPGMSGYQICEMIKGDETTRHIPVILLVGSFEPFDPGEASRVGANYYFTKPFHSIRELVDTVTEYLDLGLPSDTIYPETDDIEDLYNESFQPAPEMPLPDNFEEAVSADGEAAGVEEKTEAGPEPSEIVDVHADGADEGPVETPVAVEAPPEHQPAVENEAEVLPAKPAWRTEILSPIGESPAKKVSVAQELGDAGMDDEIIETSHPGEASPAVAGEAAAGPFDERVDHSEAVAEFDKDASMANFDWSGESAAAAQAVSEPERSTSPLKFTIEDAEPLPSSPAEDVHFAPREEPEAVRPNIPNANVSPELIEMIVQSVLEKMSDRAVRDVAKKAVPRIAEKLIREALEQEKKK
jgi:CheY-like chemotaxis protein